MASQVVERCQRLLENGATRKQVADMIGVGVKTVYKYFPANSYEALRCISGIYQ